ncbi:hypothetical protein BH10ACT11_BH10ACT11_06580 [soil metagenome]
MHEPSYEGFDVAVSGSRGELQLNRPEQLNPLSPRTLRDLAEAAGWFNQNPKVSVIVVSGKGRAFCAGADLTAFAGSSGANAEGVRRDADAGRLMADAMEGLAAVTIAKLHGHCVGGGVVLAGACDLRVAAEGTKFSIPEVDLGIPLAWGGIPRLVRDIGPALTKELVMTCRPFDATEARDAGFLNRVVPAAELDAIVEELAAGLETKPKQALLATKRHTNAVVEQMVGTARSWADADGLIAALSDAEGQAAAKRYLEWLRGGELGADVRSTGPAASARR